MSARCVFPRDGIVATIRKHITAEETLPGGGVGVGVQEAAEFRIVVAGLEVIEPGVYYVQLARQDKFWWLGIM